MIFITIIIALIIGLLMGFLGAGGAILTTPVFVYLLHFEPQIAVNNTLLVVACLSAVGSISSLIRKEVNKKAVVWFGISSIISVLITKIDLFPLIPDTILSVNGLIISKDKALMLLFGIVLFLISILGLKKNISLINSEIKSNLIYIIVGLIVGLLTGLLGVGGGFILIPALTLVFGLEMKIAIGTSLSIIFLNSTVGFLSSSLSEDFIFSNTLVVFIIFSIIGLFVGLRFRSKVSAESIKELFYGFTFFLSVLILVYEGLGLYGLVLK